MIILPKILQPHTEKENRSIEVQLNEAKKLTIILISVFCSASILTIVVFLLATYYGLDVIREISNILNALQMMILFIYLFASLIHSGKKATEDAISHK